MCAYLARPSISTPSRAHPARFERIQSQADKRAANNYSVVDAEARREKKILTKFEIILTIFLLCAATEPGRSGALRHNDAGNEPLTHLTYEVL